MPRNRQAEIERIKKVRETIMKQRGYTEKTQFAKKLGITKQALNQVETRGANANFLAALYEQFGIPADFILFGIKPPDLN